MSNVPAPKQPKQLLVPSEESPVFYHELARIQYKFSAMRVMWATVIAFVLWQFVQTTVVVIALMAKVIPIVMAEITASPGTELQPDQLYEKIEPIATEFADLNPAHPLAFGLVLATAALVPFLVWLATKMLRVPAFKYLSSVAGKLRWSLLFESVIPAVFATGVTLGVGWIVSAVWPQASMAGQHLSISKWWLVSLVLILLLVPLQAAGEEYFFRGMVMQWVGSVFRHPAWAILLPALLFTALHAYSASASISIFIIGVTLGYLTLRSGGIEMAITMHVVNNLAAFGAALLTSTGSMESSNSSSWRDVVAQLAGAVVFIAWAEWRMKKYPLVGKVTSKLPETAKAEAAQAEAGNTPNPWNTL